MPARRRARRLARDFYEREPLEVARDLLGKRLVRALPDGRRLAARLVEVEAYLGSEDLASHARFGPNGRSKVVYGEAGHAYVFLIYGMYDCLNVVAHPRGAAGCVLVRGVALEEPGARTDGPGRLTRALGIDRALNGADLVRGQELWLEDGPAVDAVATPRIGVDYAGEWAAKPLRLHVPGDPNVSRAPGKARARKTPR